MPRVKRGPKRKNRRVRVLKLAKGYYGTKHNCFRIAELQISPTQTVPWHYHSEVQDTFYVINGKIRIFIREPEEEVCLTVGQTYAVRPGRPHLVTNAGDTSAVFLVLQGGEHDFVALA